MRWIVCLWSPTLWAIEVRTVELAASDAWFNMDVAWWIVALLLCLIAGGVTVFYRVLRLLRKDQAILHLLPDLIIEVDRDGTIISRNKAFDKKSKTQTVIGTSCYDYLSEDGKALLRHHLQQALFTGQPCQYEFEAQLNGRIRFTHNRIIPLVSGGAPHALVVTSDVTGYKDAQRVLQQDKQQSERALKNKTQFLMNVGREMRGPISILNETLEHLKGSQSDANMHAMQASIEHLSQIVGDISVLAQSQQAEVELESVSTSLWHVLDDIEALYLPQAAKLQIKLALENEPLPHYMLTDAFRLRQVLYNLMSCHLGICRQGQMTLSVHSAELGQESVVQFTLTNGLDDQVADDWVAYFNQELGRAQAANLDSSSVAAFNVCKNLAVHLQGILGAKRRQDGKIQQWFTLPIEWVKQQDNFSIFKQKPIVLALEDRTALSWFRVFFQSVQLPFVEVEKGVFPEKMSLLVSDHYQSKGCQWLWWLGHDYDLSAPHGVLLTPPFKRENLYYRLTDYQSSQSKVVSDNQVSRILLVEDNLNNQLVIRRTLEKLGYEVTVANNGKEGVAQFKALDIDCIIMDIQMPVMDGIEATRQIRKLDKPYVPVIALTANGQKEIEEACFAVGMDSFLTKPISRQAMQQVLEEFLGKQSPAQDSHWT